MTIIRKEPTLISDTLHTIENEKIIRFQDLYDYVIDRLMNDQSTEIPSLQTQLPANNKRKSSDSLENPAAKRTLGKARSIFISQVKNKTR